jgi:hypothetical protein
MMYLNVPLSYRLSAGATQLPRMAFVVAWRFQPTEAEGQKTTAVLVDVSLMFKVRGALQSHLDSLSSFSFPRTKLPF